MCGLPEEGGSFRNPKLVRIGHKIWRDQLQRNPIRAHEVTPDKALRYIEPR
jgi:hypothetical protein